MAAPLMSLESPLGPRMRVDGREVDYFCGTSYHTLHGHPEVIAAATAATQAFGTGAGTRAGFPVYDELAALLADHFGSDDATYCVSGYVSPLVLLQGLAGDFDRVFVDAAAHFALRDALATLGRPVHRFAHREAGALETLLRRELRPGEVPVIVTDGVFPSSGGLAPLADLCAAMAPYAGALLCVDDSHGTGTIGATGRGSLEFAEIEGPGRYVASTTSKAIGGAGGFVPGPRSLHDKLEARAGLLKGASPPPPASAAAALAGLRVLRREPERLARLHANTARLRAGLRALGLDAGHSPVPIVTFRATRDLAAVRDGLAQAGILVKYTAARGYSDAPEVETLRIAVFSTHSEAQIDRLVAALGRIL